MRYLLLVSLITFLSTPASTEPVPIEYLFTSTREYGHQISPEARHVALLKVLSGRTYLHILRLPGLEEFKRIELGTDSISQLHWISEYRLVYRHGAALWSVNSNGTERIRIAAPVYDEQHRDSIHQIRKHLRVWHILDVLPENREEILVGGYDRKGFETISRINVFTGEKTDLADGRKYKINDWFVDREGKIRLAIRKDKGKILTFSVEGEDPSDLQLTPINVGDYALSYSGGSFLDNKAYFEDFAGPENVYLSERVNRDRFVISEYSYKQNKKIKTIVEDELVDIGSHVSSVFETLVHDPYTKKLVGVRYEREKLVQLWFDKEIESVQLTLNKALPEYINVIADWDKKRNTFLVIHYSDKEPGVSSIYLKDLKQISALEIEERRLLDYKLSSSKWNTFTARDGTRIPVYVVRGKNSTDKLPLVVLPHGGPWSRDTWSFDPYAQALASRGYLVLQPQFRGSTGFGYKHLTKARKDMGGVMIDDIADSAKWAIENELADPNRIYIYGVSYGGYAAIMASYRYPDLFKAAVSNSPPVDLVRHVKDYKKDDSVFAYEYWQSMVGDPKEEKAALAAISPTELVNEFNFPLLLVAAEEDDIIKIDQIKEFEKLAKKFKKTNIEVQVFKNESHGIERPSNQTYLTEKMIDFFRKNETSQ